MKTDWLRLCGPLASSCLLPKRDNKDILLREKDIGQELRTPVMSFAVLYVAIQEGRCKALLTPQEIEEARKLLTHSE